MKKIFTMFTAISFCLNFNAQTITLDTSFGVNGIASVPLIGEGDDLQMLVSQDSKIIAYGKDVPSSTSIHPNKVYKFNLDGNLDTSFGISGTLTLPDYKGSLTIVNQGLDKFLVVFSGVNYGYHPDATYTDEKAVLRYNLNGTLDNSFSNNGELRIPYVGGDDFRNFNLAVLTDNSFIIADTAKYSKFSANGLVDTSYGTNGIINVVNSGNIQLFGSDILNFYPSKIDKLTIYGTANNGFATSGTFTFPISSDYYSKQNSNGNIGSLDLNLNTFFNISSSGILLNTINLTNDSNTLDNYSNFVSTGSNNLFVGTSTNSNPFIVSYDNNGNLITLNGQNSYKETTLPIGNYTSILVKDNAIYIGGDKVDTATNKWYYIVAKYNLSTLLSTQENNLENSMLFENPIKTNLNFSTKEMINTIEIYSIDGKNIMTIKGNNTNVVDLTRGIYIAKINFQNGKTIVKKLIKN